MSAMPWTDLLGITAALAVLATFCMTNIVLLRSVAIASNLLFILYGMLGHIYPVFFLHLTLLPINLIKLHRTRHRAPELVGRARKTSNSLSGYLSSLATSRPNIKMGSSESYSNASTIVLLRTTLDEVFSDHRFYVRKSLSPCQISQYVLTKIRQGERDLDWLKAATLEKFNGDCPLSRKENRSDHVHRSANFASCGNGRPAQVRQFATPRLAHRHLGIGYAADGGLRQS